MHRYFLVLEFDARDDAQAISVGNSMAEGARQNVEDFEALLNRDVRLGAHHIDREG